MSNQKREFSEAVLVPKMSIAQFVIQQLLAGIMIRVMIDGKPRMGYIHQLDLAKGNDDFVFASVSIDNIDNPDENIYLRVAVYGDGSVKIMPNQAE
jgi:hypothetical protein